MPQGAPTQPQILNLVEENHVEFYWSWEILITKVHAWVFFELQQSGTMLNENLSVQKARDTEERKDAESTDPILNWSMVKLRSCDSVLACPSSQ